MGTSGAFKGSGGKDAGDLRDAIAGWLGDDAGSDSPNSNEPSADGGSTNPLSPSAISSVIGMWRTGSRGSGSGGGGGGGGGGGAADGRSAGSGGGRSSGGVRRSVARVSGPAGRAGSLARAYSTGNREALESAGLNYDELRALNDPLEIGQRIAEVAFDTQADSTLEDSEARMIVAELVSWILEAPDDRPPAPDEIVRHSIELMIAQSALLEVGDTIRQEKNQAKRHEAEAEIRRGAQVLASQVTLGDMGATSEEITTAIESGVAQLKEIYGASE
ncbi:hypothetical protein ITJ66_16850 [Plantibacter sp. VKM Ac-2885]|uniref:hypothetical protein n=1 Tax=Plantibacter sp. VKM Ac-2885 TaxID=2783828 RepID=UPI00188B760A|nr:hypothetical protein [Plantibacter sp. VKM Ac-2885]MBF4514156.1 hypothetical protein [Plantibacter sp. VKM Ac-2885]